MIYQGNDYRNYLAHHGILGMKWGDRNGPPYPLTGAAHSPAEKKVGWRKSLGGGRNESLYAERAAKKQQKRNFKAFKKQVKKSGRVSDTDLQKRIDSDENVKAAQKKLWDAESRAENKVFKNEASRSEWAKRAYEDSYDRSTSKDDYLKTYTKESNPEVAKRIVDSYLSSSKGSKSLREIREAENEYARAVNKVIDDHLGKFGDTSITARRMGRGAKFQTSAKELRKNEHFLRDEKSVNEHLDRAKKTDRYDLNFLEAIQNKTYMSKNDKKSKQKRLNEYKKYLQDPEWYWEHRSRRDDE